MKILVLGMGNSILCDDGAGPRVIAELRKLDLPADVALEQTSLSGFNLMEYMAGHDHAIIVDALRSGREPGTVLWLTPQHFDPQPSQTCSEHSMGIFQALKLGKDLGQNMPANVDVLAIEAADTRTFTESLTPQVESAIPQAVDYIAGKLAHLTGLYAQRVVSRG